MRRSKCPICKQEFVLSDGPDAYTPFCSRRCKDADLSRWFGEQYMVPVESERVVREFIDDEERRMVE